MSIQGLNRIIQEKEKQFGSMNKGADQSLATEMELIKQALSTLAENQKLIYSKLEDIERKLGE